MMESNAPPIGADRDDDDELGDFEPIADREADDDDVDEPRPIDVGDHVQLGDEDEPATMVVVGTPIDATARTYTVKGKPICEWSGNEPYPRDDDVVEVKFPGRTDVSLTDGTRYAYPGSRLEVVAGVHDRDGDEGGDE